MFVSSPSSSDVPISRIVVEAVGCKRGRDAGHRAGMIAADNYQLENIAGQPPRFDGDSLFRLQTRQQPHVTRDVRRRAALEIARRQTLEVPLHHHPINVRALAAN